MIKEGVLGYTKDRLFNGSLEYFIGDGVHKYSELTKYAAAEASSSKKANTLVLRDASGKIDKLSLPDDLTDLIDASTTKKANNVVKADGNGSLDGWKDAISDAVQNPASGLVKNSDGTLGVDFNRMPTDKFEELLKSLKMLVPLTANLDLYVDKNSSAAGDTLVDGRGTQSKPFKTIQAAVNFVTETYSIGRYTVTIHVAQAVYEENVTLPEYSRTTGYINLSALNDNAPPTLKFTGHVGTLISCSGVWRLRRFNIQAVYTDPDNGVSNYTYAVSVSGDLSIYGCAFDISYSGAAPQTTLPIYILRAGSKGYVRLSVMSGYSNSFTFDKGNASSLTVLMAEGGSITIPRSNITDDGIMYNIPCSGNASIFARANGGVIATSGSGLNRQQFTGNVTGKKYQADGGGHISYTTAQFPGDTPGTVESSSYSWAEVISE